MSKVLWILLIIIGLLSYWAWRRMGADKTQHPQPTPYRCVSVEPGWIACRAALDAREKRYLPHEAPPIPRPGCTADVCECRYRHHADRRHNVRRSADLGIGNPHFMGEDRRLAYDRRRASEGARATG